MKIAVISINIGKYIDFWEDFYKSAKKNFLPEHIRHFFVFTDQKQILFQHRKDVSVIQQKNLGWPGNTLMRYEMFCRIENKLKDFDYIFFANANLYFFKPVGDEILPKGNERLVFVQRQTSYIWKKPKMPYETNPRSTAYVRPGESSLYVRGGFNGGCAEAFLEMSRILRNQIETDRKNGITAVWHDESHLARYVIGRKDVKILSPGYLYPEGLVMPYPKMILIRPKDNQAVRFGTEKGRILIMKDKAFLTFRNLIYIILIRLRVIKF